jgi:protein gp37
MAGRTVGDPIQLHHDRLDSPLHWKKPRRVFVNSLSDVFHEDVPDAFIDLIFAAMAQAPWHTFQILTKRPTRMRGWFDGGEHLRMTRCFRNFNDYDKPVGPWPLPHVWLGVSVEDQQTADERIPILLQTPAVVRWVSAEPLLGPINLREVNPFDDFHTDALDTPDPSFKLNWVVVGGESGPQARPCNVGWIRTLVRQCQAAQVPCFVKQVGSRPCLTEGSVDAEEWGAFGEGAPVDDCGQIHCKSPKGGEPSEWMPSIRVREWPKGHGVGVM